MSTGKSLKPTLSPKDVQQLLENALGSTVSSVEAISEGHLSQAYRLQADGQRLIARFNRSRDSFDKDRRAQQLFGSTPLPIPRIQMIQALGDYYLALSDEAPGRSLTNLARDEHRALVPAVIEVLVAIAAVDVAPWPGYGSWNAEGSANERSWQEELLSINNRAPHGLYENWQRLFRTAALEQDVWELLFSHLERAAESAPEQRWLVHHDFGGSNLLAADGQITAVIDWGNAAYGDLVYDLAPLTFWWGDFDWEAEYLRRVTALLGEIANFKERLFACQLYYALTCLRFFAVIGNRSAYDWTKKRALTLLDS